MTKPDTHHDRCDHGYDIPRENRGRRHSDRLVPLEIHPVAISVGVGVLSVILAVLGYFFKSWGDNVTYEIHQLRIVVQDQAQESAANSEWKTDMGRWRDGVDAHFQVIDDKLFNGQLYHPKMSPIDHPKNSDQQTKK